MTALKSALEVIKGASDKEAARAVLIQSNQTAPEAEAKVISNHRSLDFVEDDIGDLNMAFLQKSQSARVRAITLLQKGSADMTLEQRKERALATLAEEGKRLG